MTALIAGLLVLGAAPLSSPAARTSAAAAFRSGLAACDQGNWTEALALEANAVTSEPDNAWFQYGWAAANGLAATKAGIFSRLAYARKSLAGYRRAAELDARNPTFHLALLRWYALVPWFAGGDRQAAVREAALLMQIDPAQAKVACRQLNLPAPVAK